jgi:type IV secretory pathway VirB10-like protein
MKDIKSLLPDTPSFIALILVISIVSLVFVLAITGKSDSDIFKILVGGLMTVGFTNIVGFYFGSSQGSKDKDTALASIASGTGSGTGAATTAAAVAAAPAAAEHAAPPAAAVAAPPAAEVAVEAALEKREEHKP